MAEISGHTLPEDVIIEILLRVQDVKRVLNTKSIGRCRCVSKTWRSLLSGPQFAASRLDGPVNFFFIDEYNYHECDLPVPPEGTYVATLGDHAAVTKVELPFHQGQPFHWTPVQGSLHGLVLLVFGAPEKGLILVNPTTLEALEIPSYGGGYKYDYGLGYDSCTDDYKVVSIQEDNVDVFSVRTRTWRTIPNVRSKHSEDSCSFCYDIDWPTRPFVNGHINFVSLTGAIAAFNVGTEELESVPHPQEIRKRLDKFTVLGGCLAIYSRDSRDIWLMKEYGVQDSWTKIFTFKPDPVFYVPLCFLDEDENELASTEESLTKSVVRDGRSGAVRDVLKYDYILASAVISFRESLISPIYN